MNKYIHLILLVIMTLMTTCTISSCSDESFDENSNGYGKLKFEAILPCSNDMSTRTVYVQTQYGKLKSGWESNDRISVYGFASGTYTFTNPDIDKSTDDISRWSNSEAEYQREEDLVAVYPALPINNNGIVEMDFSNQDGTLENLKNYDLMVSDKVPYEQTEVKFQMIRKNVFLRISINEVDIENYEGEVSITLHGLSGLNKLSFNTQNQGWDLIGSNDEIVVNCSNSISPINGIYYYYVAIPAKKNVVVIDKITVRKGDFVTEMEYRDKLNFVPGHIYSTELKGEVTTAYLAHGDNVNEAITNLIGDKAKLRKITFVVKSNRTSNVNIKFPDETGLINPSPRNNIYVISENGGTEILICTRADKIVTSNVPAGMFKDFTNLEIIENLSMLCTDGATLLAGVTSSEDSRTRDMSEMFMNCHSLKSLDLSSFATQTVIIFASMFEGCTSLTSLDISSFHTKDNYSLTIASILTPTYGFIESKRMNNMFKNCNKLEEINFGVNFDITKFYYSGIFRAGLEGITGTFSGTPDSMRIITNKDTRDQLTYTQRWPAINVPDTMGLTGKTIKWINAETGQPLQ